MTRSKKIVLGAAAALGLIAFALALAAPREPRFEGRRLQEWVADLSDKDSAKQERARQVIRQMGPEAVPFLTQTLNQGETVSQRLYRSGIFPRRFANWARSMIRREEPLTMGHNAALSLALMGPDAKEAIPTLIQTLREPSTWLAQAAGRALASIGPDALPALQQRLGAAGPAEMPQVMNALGEMGPAAAPIVHDLAKFLSSTHHGYASVALGKIGHASIPAVSPYLAHTNPVVRFRALVMLQRLGPDTPFELITPHLNDADPAVRLQAHFTLASTLGDYEMLNPYWLKGLTNSDVEIVQLSVRQLTIRPRDVRAYNHELAPLAQHTNQAVRSIVSNSLTRFHAWPNRN